MREYNVTYKQYIVRESRTIRVSGCSCITFENLGTANVTINGCIPLAPNSEVTREFNEKPYVKINSDFGIDFTIGEGLTNKVLVIEAYYTEL